MVQGEHWRGSLRGRTAFYLTNSVRESFGRCRLDLRGCGRLVAGYCTSSLCFPRRAPLLIADDLVRKHCRDVAESVRNCNRLKPKCLSIRQNSTPGSLRD